LNPCPNDLPPQLLHAYQVFSSRRGGCGLQHPSRPASLFDLTPDPVARSEGQPVKCASVINRHHQRDVAGLSREGQFTFGVGVYVF
jgi:hypothetical protein